MATAKNEHTGDSLISRGLTKAGEENFDRIFPKKKKERYVPPALPSDDEWPEDRIDVIGQNGNIGYE